MLVLVDEVVSDVEGAHGVAHVAVDDGVAVAPRAQELRLARDVHVELAVRVDVVPRQVLYVLVCQAPGQIVV